MKEQQGEPTAGFHHDTVLKHEVVDGLALKPGDTAIDCTLGGGGHTQALLERVGASGKVIALERDEDAIAAASKRLARYLTAGNLVIVQTSFSEFEQVMKDQMAINQISGVCADIGVSSHQIDTAARGFSFAKSGPLDMRMNRGASQTAADLVNNLSERELTEMFRDYGEEPKAKFVAQAIVKQRAARPLTRTDELADLVADAIHYKTASRTHPATRVFQALRIAVNDELNELTTLLSSAFSALMPTGRLAVISFHSLEDRIVKDFFLELTGQRKRANVPRHLPLTEVELQQFHAAKARVVKPFPRIPSDDELKRNPRARSAKLRIIEKINS